MHSAEPRADAFAASPADGTGMLWSDASADAAAFEHVASEFGPNDPLAFLHSPTHSAACWPADDIGGNLSLSFDAEYGHDEDKSAEWMQMQSDATFAAPRINAWNGESEPSAAAAAAAAMPAVALRPASAHPSFSPASHAASASYSAASSAPTRRPPHRACISCGKLKQSCSHTRPCDRCSNLGVPCIDRTEEEIAAASAVRKRKSAATREKNRQAKQEQQAGSADASAASSPSPLPALSAQLPFERIATDELSAELYSRSLLATLFQIKLRDTMLELHDKIRALPPQVALLLQFPMHSNKLMSLLCEHLIEAHFITYLVGGLTPEQLNSESYRTSPLAAWLTPHTRPMFTSYEERPAFCIRGDLTKTSDADRSAEGIAKEDTEAPAQLRMSFLPDAVASFRRWQRATHVAPVHVRRSSQQHVSNDPLWHHAQQSLGVTDEARRVELLNDAGRSVLAADRTAADDADLELFETTLRYLSISHAVGADTQADGASRDADVPGVNTAHARWCPMHCAGEHTAATGKRHHVEQSAAASASPSQADDPSCVCSRSVSLPAIVHVNASFERLFGFSQHEVSQLIAREGLGQFARRLYAPSAWPQLHRMGAVQWQKMTQLTLRVVSALQSKLESAASAASSPAPSSIASTSPPTPSDSSYPSAGSAIEISQEFPLQITTKLGATLPALVRQVVLHTTDDGAASEHEVSGYVQVWIVGVTHVAVKAMGRIPGTVLLG